MRNILTKLRNLFERNLQQKEAKIGLMIYSLRDYQNVTQNKNKTGVLMQETFITNISNSSKP